MSQAHLKSSSSSETSSPQVGGGAINEKKRWYGKEIEKSPSRSNRNDEHEIEKKLGVHALGPGKSNFDPENASSHLLHALAGLDRYPNYLSRWNFDLKDVDRLEQALEDQLAKVRLQKQNIMARNQQLQLMKENVVTKLKDDNDDEEEEEVNGDSSSFDIFNVPYSWREIKLYVLHPNAADAIFGSRQFRSVTNSSNPPTVEEVVQGKVDIELDLHQLAEWMNEECFDVYSFPLLSKSFCRKIVKALQCFAEEAKLDNTNLENFGKMPVDLDSIGLSWVNDLIFHLVIRPLSRHLFASTEKFEDLDWRQGYIAGYSSTPLEEKGAQRHRLVPHTDDSEVTLNVGMGNEDFQGGDLVFWNLRGTQNEGHYVGEFHPKMGYAILHSGRHLHEVTQVTKGDRYAYIIWARSWKSLRQTTCPCCWLTRRRQSPHTSNNRCMCQPQWN